MRGDDGARADRSFLRRRRGGFMQHVRHHTQYSGLFDSFNQDERKDLSKSGQVLSRENKSGAQGEAGHFPFASMSSSCVRSSAAAPFWRNAKPMNPSTTKTTPAIINQCGYSIAESIRSFPFA